MGAGAVSAGGEPGAPVTVTRVTRPGQSAEDRLSTTRSGICDCAGCRPRPALSDTSRIWCAGCRRSTLVLFMGIDDGGGPVAAGVHGGHDLAVVEVLALPTPRW